VKAPQQYLIVGVGAAIGASLRFFINELAKKHLASPFPWATFGINIAGSLLLGAFLGLSQRHALAPHWQLFVAVGLLGGFTTFSSYSAESVLLLRQGNMLSFLVYVLGSNVLAIGAAAVGYWVLRAQA